MPRAAGAAHDISCQETMFRKRCGCNTHPTLKTLMHERSNARGDPRVSSWELSWVFSHHHHRTHEPSPPSSAPKAVQATTTVVVPNTP